ncbi:hypothetical protein ACOSQ2_022504 [Xanthoceras sorbifolium]
MQGLEPHNQMAFTEAIGPYEQSGPSEAASSLVLGLEITGRRPKSSRFLAVRPQADFIRIDKSFRGKEIRTVVDFILNSAGLILMSARRSYLHLGSSTLLFGI